MFSLAHNEAWTKKCCQWFGHTLLLHAARDSCSAEVRQSCAKGSPVPNGHPVDNHLATGLPVQSALQESYAACSSTIMGLPLITLLNTCPSLS